MTEETYDFADLPLQGDGANPQKPSGDYPSIDAVINKPIWCTGFTEVLILKMASALLYGLSGIWERLKRLFGRAVKNYLPL